MKKLLVGLLFSVLGWAQITTIPGGGGLAPVPPPSAAAFASQPTCNAAALNQVWLQPFLEGPYKGVCGSSGWLYTAHGHTAEIPPSTGWSPVNSASVSATGGVRVLTAPSAGSPSLVGEARSMGANTTFTACLEDVALAQGTTDALGIWFRESATGKLAFYAVGFTTANTYAQTWANPTTFVGNYTETNHYPKVWGSTICWKFVYGATDRTISLVNPGFTANVHTVAKNDGATTAYDQVGWFVRNDVASTAKLYHWSEE